MASNLRGATILLNGMDTGLKTPATIVGLTPGAYRVTVATACERGEATVNVLADQTTRANVLGVTTPGTVIVDVEPATAVLTVDDGDQTLVGGIPGKLGCGAHTIRGTLDGYIPAAVPVTIAAGAEQRVTMHLQQLGMGSVDLTVTPRAATILFDGKAVGSDAVTLPSVFEGNHVVSAEMDGYQTATRTIAVEAGVDLLYHIDLRRNGVSRKSEVTGGPVGGAVTTTATGSGSKASQDAKKQAEAQAKARADADAAAAAAAKAASDRKAAQDAAAKQAERDAAAKAAQDAAVAAAAAQARQEAEAQLEAERQARLQAEAKAEAERQARLEAEAEAETERQAAADALAKAEAERRAKADAMARAETERKAKAAAEAKAEAERQAKADAEAQAEAERKARAEAQALAEAERKAKTDAEARAEADRKARSDAEARAKSDATRKAAADAAAKATAEAERKRQADEDAAEAREAEKARKAADAEEERERREAAEAAEAREKTLKKKKKSGASVGLDIAGASLLAVGAGTGIGTAFAYGPATNAYETWDSMVEDARVQDDPRLAKAAEDYKSTEFMPKVALYYGLMAATPVCLGVGLTMVLIDEQAPLFVPVEGGGMVTWSGHF